MTFIIKITYAHTIILIPPTFQAFPSKYSHVAFSCDRIHLDPSFPALQSCLDKAKQKVKIKSDPMKVACHLKSLCIPLWTQTTIALPTDN